MSRSLTDAAAAAANAAVVRPAIFFEGEFASGTLRLWSGVGPIEWDGKTWTGAGHMLGIAPIEELSDVRAAAFHVSLSGDAAEILSVNLGQARSGLPGKVWLGFFAARSLTALRFTETTTPKVSKAVEGMSSSQMSVEMWVRYDTGGDYFVLARNWVPNGWLFGITSSERAFFGVGDSGGSQHTCSSNAALTAGQVYHLVGTYDGSKVRLYVDGVAQTAESNASVVTNTINTTAAVELRWRANVAGQDATADGVRMYARALSADEVRQHYAGVYNDESDLVARWEFEEGTGSVATDWSGNGNDGALTGSPEWVEGIGRIDAERLIADPFLAFQGRFDVPDIVIEGGRASIQARYESRLIDLDRIRERRYTSEDQKIDHPGDRGFDYVPSLQDKELYWGRADQVAPAPRYPSSR